MGNFNCKGKISKESKNQMRGEAYRPSKPDPQGKETIHVVDTPVNENGKVEDAVVTNAKIPFVNPETPTKSESVMQGPNTSLSDTNGLKANDSMGKQDEKQHESDAILQKLVKKTSKDVVSSAIIKNNSGEETNLKEAPPTGITLNKVPGSKSDDAEDDHSYLFAAGRKEEEPQIEDSEFIDKKTGKSDDDSAHIKDEVISSNEASPTDKATNDSSTTETSSKKVENLPTDNAGGNDSETMKGGSDKTKEIDNNPNSKPSDKSQPENGSSDNQQNNEDPTGYEGSKFSKLGDEQDREISEEMKSGKLNEKKKKKKNKRDKYGPPANAIIHHYYGYTETVNIGNDNINYYGRKEEPKKEKDEFQQNFKISARKMEILLAVSKSVGIFHGPKANGTCWRVGEDKIITAAHVVNDNIWNKMINTEIESSLDKCYVDFNYVDKNKRSSNAESDLNVFKIEPQVMYKNEVLDVAVLKLKREKDKNFPRPLDLFDSLDPEKDDYKEIYLIGHNKSDEKNFNFRIGLWTPTETKMKDMEKFCLEYGKPNGYIGLDRKDRLVIKCEFVRGASGCPGVVIYKDKAYVVLVYVRGFPDFYYSQQFPEKKREEFPKDRLLQQGVNIGSVFKTMTENKMNLGLRNEIFPHEAILEQQASGQNPNAIGGASSFQNEKNLKGQETEKKSGKWTTCTEGHSETAIPDSAKYNRQPSYALAIDDRVDIAYPNMKPPGDDTDITLQHGHSQNIAVPRNDQNYTQETNLDVNKDSQSRMANNSSEIPDMTQGEKSVPYTNPGKTQPVKDITIEMSSSYEPQLCKHCGKLFTNKSKLRQHELWHQNEGPYECSLEKCSFKSFSKANHERHTRSHSEKRPFECTTCGKCFKGKTELKKHENRENNNKRFQCSYCDKLFEEKKQLKDHLGIHSGVKDHRCTVCNKNFLYRSNLNRHKKTHDVKEEYSYSICGKLYNRKDNLKQHQAVHNRGIPCTQCEKIFTSKRYLDAHMKRKHQL